MMRCLALPLIFLAASANAQSYDFVGSMSPYSWSNTTQYLDSSVALDETVKNNTKSDIPVSYTPSKSRTRANLAAFVNKTRAVDPTGAAQMEQLFASTDVIDQIGSIMAQVGLSQNNAADAFTVYWISAWQASQGDTSTPTQAKIKAVAAQAARGLSQSPEFAAATDAQKQEMAEALMVQAALIDAAVEQSASDPTQMKALAKAVLQGAAESGLELDKMTLTEQGFQKVD